MDGVVMDEGPLLPTIIMSTIPNILLINSSKNTQTLVLSAYTFVGQFNTQWHYAMAAMVLAVLPSIIIFIFLQKYIVEGVVAGAVKG